MNVNQGNVINKTPVLIINTFVLRLIVVLYERQEQQEDRGENS